MSKRAEQKNTQDQNRSFSDFLLSSSEWKYSHCCTTWASSPEYFSKWPVTNYIRVTPSLMAHRDCDVSGQSQHNWLSINIL